MLLLRSILVQVLLLCLVRCQSYEYNSGENEDDHNSEYTEEKGQPDYSKYYQDDTQSTLVSSPELNKAPYITRPNNFDGGLDFSSFFTSPTFDFGSPSEKQEISKPSKPTSSGFLEEFQAGFPSSHDPFGKDFFEQAQQKQQTSSETEEETKPGPNYISQRLPAYTDAYEDEIQDLNKRDHKKENLNKVSKAYDEENSKESLEDDGSRENEDKETRNRHQAEINVKPLGKVNYGAQRNPWIPIQAPYTEPKLSPYQKYSFQPAKPTHEDNLGLKTAYPSYINDYLLSGALTSEGALTSIGLSGGKSEGTTGGTSGGFFKTGPSKSNLAPFNPTYSKLTGYEAQPTQLNHKKCKKLNKFVQEKDVKTGRYKRQPMSCYVCEDPKTRANFEQCSYGSEPNSKLTYSESGRKYSNPTKTSVDSYRFRRYAPRYEKPKENQSRNRNKREEYQDPYERIKAASHQYYSTPKEFSESYYSPKDFGEVQEYNFGADFFSGGGGEEEKSSSEAQSEKLVEDAGNCRKVQKNSMTCTVCKNAKTGGNLEQCSYSSAPPEKKYAYVREHKYENDDGAEESRAPEKKYHRGPKNARVERERESEKRPQEKLRYKGSIKKNDRSKESTKYHDGIKRSSRYSDQDGVISTHRPSKRAYREEQPKNEGGGKNLNYREPKNEDDSYEIPEHFAESTKIANDDTSEESDKYLDDYGYNFHNYNDESETKKEEKRADPYDYTEGNRKDVEDVLAEFSKKDRTNCRKAEKNGMTCYLCTDSKGVKNEECMFVSESQPKASHLAYHEVKQIKVPENQTQENASDKRKRFFKKVTTQSPVDVAAEPSKEISSRIRTTTPLSTISAITTPLGVKPTRQFKRTKNIPKDVKSESKDFRSDLEKSETNVKSKKAKFAEPTIRTPKEFEVEGTDGAFASETQVVFSKNLGISLPRYMLTKSIAERNHDEFVRAN